MPVPIHRTDWRLDRVVDFGVYRPVDPNTDVTGGSTMQAYELDIQGSFGGYTSLGYVLEWRFRRSLRMTGATEIILYTTANAIGTDWPDANGGVRGEVRKGTQLDIAGETYVIESFWQTERADWLNSRGNPVSPPNWGVWGGEPAEDGSRTEFTQPGRAVQGYWSGFGLRTDRPVTGFPSVATFLLDQGGMPSFIADITGRMFVQRESASSAVTNEETDDGGQEITEAAEYIARRPLSVANGIIVDGGVLYRVESVEPLGRTGYWNIGVRRTFRVAAAPR